MCTNLSIQCTQTFRHLCVSVSVMKWRTYRGCHTVAHNIFLDCCMPEEKKFGSDYTKEEF